MNPFSRIMGDAKKKPLKQMKYEIDWNAQTIEPVSFASPVHDSYPVKKSPESCISKISFVQPKLEKGSIDLNEVETGELFKKQGQPLKRISKTLRERFSTDFFRSKSLQKLNNQDEHEVDFNNLYDCKQTTSIGKIKKQARVIDVHVQQLNTTKSSPDGKTLLNGKPESPLEKTLLKIETVSGLRRDQIAYALLLIIGSYFVLTSLDKVIYAIIAFVFPLYFSAKALNTTEATGNLEQKKCLTYWAVFAFISSFDAILPSFGMFYCLLKAAFLLYLYSPYTQGAEKIFNFIVNPIVLFVEQSFNDICHHYKTK